MPLRLLMTTVLVITVGGLLSPTFMSVQDSASSEPFNELALLQDEDQGPYFLTCDAAISVDVRPVTRESFSEEVEVGLVFGTPRDKSSRSLFGIRPSEQTFRIGVKRDTVDNLVGPFFSDAIEPEGFNRLQVRIERGNVVFSINGSPVAEVGGALRTRGLMGMYVGGFGAPNIGGRYDNFQVEPMARTEECPPLQDDFSNPESGWAEQQSSGNGWVVTWTYTDDEQYEMRKVRSATMHAATTQVDRFRDFIWSGPAVLFSCECVDANIDVKLPRTKDVEIDGDKFEIINIPIELNITCDGPIIASCSENFSIEMDIRSIEFCSRDPGTGDLVCRDETDIPKKESFSPKSISCKGMCAPLGLGTAQAESANYSITFLGNGIPKEVELVRVRMTVTVSNDPATTNCPAKDELEFYANFNIKHDASAVGPSR